MVSNRKLRVAVVYGGMSGEHEVSLVSAAAVIKNLDKTRYEVVPIAINKQGGWMLNQLPEVLISEVRDMVNGDVQATSTGTQLIVSAKNSISISPPQAEKNLPNIANQYFDVIVPIVHGPLYEDGCLQGLFELAQIPYVGCSVLASAIAMDKYMTKQVLAQAGIPVLPARLVLRRDWKNDAAKITEEICRDFSFPVFVKPTNLGSSVGAAKAKNTEELIAAINNAARYGARIMIEKAIRAREIELSVLENPKNTREPFVSIPGEIAVTAKHEFYSYEAKYIDPEGADLLVPAKITQEQRETATRYAREAFQLMACEGMARVDFFLDKDDGALYVNELNTIPGFTSISMYPRLWEASGINFTELLNRLIELAMLRHEENKATHRDWLEQ